MSNRELPPPPLIAPTPSNTLPPCAPLIVIDVAVAAEADVCTATARPPTSNPNAERRTQRRRRTLNITWPFQPGTTSRDQPTLATSTSQCEIRSRHPVVSSLPT